MVNWLKKAFCKGDPDGGAVDKSSSNVSCACNCICCGKAGNSTPSFQQRNKKALQKSHTKGHGPAAQPKEERAASTQSKDGDGDPNSLLNSNSEPSSESGSTSFYSAPADSFEDADF